MFFFCFVLFLPLLLFWFWVLFFFSFLLYMENNTNIMLFSIYTRGIYGCNPLTAQVTSHLL